MNQHLLLGDSLDAYAASMHAAIDLMADHLRSIDQPLRGTTVDDARARVAAVDLNNPAAGGLDAVMSETRDLYLRDAVHFHHPDYVAHLNCPVTVASLVAEVMSSAINTSVDTWDQSVTATAMEQRLIDWTGCRIGFDAPGGVFTSGGTASNLHSLALARAVALDGTGVDQADLRILVSEHTHFSVGRAARLLGLSDDAVVSLPGDQTGALDPHAVARSIARLRSGGEIPMAVVATAGTTDLGLIDPLIAIGRLCRSEGVWMHVDAAYGGGLLTSVRRRHLIDGIEYADSVTVDFHKTFFLPVSASAVIVRNAETLGLLSHHADYLNPRGSEAPNLVDHSLQTTRRFDALKLWTTLRAVGADGIGEMLDRVIDLAAGIASVLDDDEDFVLAGRPTLSTVVFRYEPGHLGQAAKGGPFDDVALDRLQPQLRAALFAEGRVVVAGTVLNGRSWLKLTLLNPSASLDQLRGVMEAVRSTGAILVRHMLDRQDYSSPIEVQRVSAAVSA